MMGHKICFNGQIWLIIAKLSLLPLLIWSSGIFMLQDLYAQKSVTPVKSFKIPGEM